MEVVTIVIPVFKPNRNYLEELFISISHQQFKEFRVVISDDDNDQELILSTVPEDLIHKIKYVKNEGSHGIFGNLNNGLLHADGEYIQIFCQDDVMLPMFISNNYNCLSNTSDAKMVISLSNFMIGPGTFKHFDYKFIEYIPHVLFPKEANDYLLYFGCIPGNLSAVMFKNSVPKQIGLFDSNLKFAGDYEYWVRIAQTNKIIISRDQNLNIRNHNKSASIVLGTFIRYFEIKDIHQFLIENNKIPFKAKTLIRYLHIDMLRAIISFLIRRNISLKQDDWRMLRAIFNGKPYSLWIAFLSFLNPKSGDVKKLINYMEVNRN